jgi:hypothetical protein
VNTILEQGGGAVAAREAGASHDTPKTRYATPRLEQLESYGSMTGVSLPIGSNGWPDFEEVFE